MAYAMCIKDKRGGSGYMTNINARERSIFAALVSSKELMTTDDDEDKENVPPLIIRLFDLSLDHQTIKTDACLWVLGWLRSTPSDGKMATIKAKSDYQQLVVLADKMALRNLLEDLQTWYVTYIACPRHLTMFTMFANLKWSKARLAHYNDLTPAIDYVFASAHGLDRVCIALERLIVSDLQQNGMDGKHGSDAKDAFLDALTQTKMDIVPHFMLTIL